MPKRAVRKPICKLGSMMVVGTPTPEQARSIGLTVVEIAEAPKRRARSRSTLTPEQRAKRIRKGRLNAQKPAAKLKAAHTRRANAIFRHKARLDALRMANASESSISAERKRLRKLQDKPIGKNGGRFTEPDPDTDDDDSDDDNNNSRDMDSESTFDKKRNRTNR